MKTTYRYHSILVCRILLLFCAPSATSQSVLTLDTCHALARQQYPLIKQLDLVEKSKAYTIDNAHKNKLPQIIFAGQATYQSDVTSVPISVPNIEIPQPGKDQYKLYGEVSQSINELYTIKDKIALAEANSAVEKQRVEVELYKLHERINQLYFGILLVDAQLDQTALLKKDLQSGLDKTNAMIQNGTAIRSNAAQLEAEMIKADQRTLELQAMRNAFINMLSQFIDQPLTPETKFVRPVTPSVSQSVNRPEISLFQLQRETYNRQDKILRNNNRPQFNVFVQGGIGRPALNFLSEDLDPYYIGGLRFTWNFSKRNLYQNDKALLELQQQSLDQQQETFLFNTKLSGIQQNAEIEKYQQLIETDQAMIELREEVSNTTKIQLENGTATTNDYIQHVNATDLARQNLALHELQLLQTQYNYLYTQGQ